MNFSDDEKLVSERLPKMQIIQGAIVAGAIIYAIVAFALREGGVINGRAQEPIVSYACSALAVMSLIQFPFITRKMAKENRKKLLVELRSGDSAEMKTVNDTAFLLASFQTQMIVGAAILEGATFGLIVAFLVDGTYWTILGALVLSGVNAFQFPTRARIERWLEEQRELIEQERAGIA
jgi:hypothetical protein